MHKTVQEYVRTCDLCQRMKAPRLSSLSTQTSNCARPTSNFSTLTSAMSHEEFPLPVRDLPVNYVSCPVWLSKVRALSSLCGRSGLLIQPTLLLACLARLACSMAS
jgi:hypothetical protein